MVNVSNCVLWNFRDKYCVTSDDHPDRMLVMDRISYTVSIEPFRISTLDCLRQSISGLLGIIQLISGPHLIIVTKKEKIGYLTSENHAVWKTLEVSVLPFSKSEMHLTPDELSLNRKQRTLIEDHIKGNRFYFSHTYDLTNTLQRTNSSFDTQRKPSVASINPNFAWNFNILRPFCASSDLMAFCLVLIQGAVFINNCSINGKYFRWVLISRRSNKRAGTRFFRRGCDNFGNVANFVETEQIVERGDSLSSFVQTRGSIPLFWSQTPDMRYMPSPKLHHHLDSNEAFLLHLREQVQNYGHQVFVNLVNHSKAEGQLQSEFASLCQKSGSSDLTYLAFDFHKECSKLRWDRLHILMEQCKAKLFQFGYFIKSKTLHLNKVQNGVFRTNCMDCLDRTNVVQSMLAKENLNMVLKDFGVLSNEASTTAHPDFTSLFRRVWAEHGDVLAKQYAGSRAMKTDLTRTGKRTLRGALQDLLTASFRYWINNFFDGQRQDAIDLFLGSTTVTDVKSMLAEPAKGWVYYLPLFFVVNLSLILLTILLVGQFEADHHLWLIFLVASALLCGSIVVRKSHIFVDRPKFT